MPSRVLAVHNWGVQVTRAIAISVLHRSVLLPGGERLEICGSDGNVDVSLGERISNWI